MYNIWWTYLPRSDLRHVKNDDSWNKADPKARDKTTGHQLRNRSGPLNTSVLRVTHQTETRWSSLQTATNNKYNTAGNDSNPSTEVIGKVTSDDRAKESSSGKNGSDQRLLPSWQGEGVFGGLIRIGARNRKTRHHVDEIIHTQHAVHVSRIEAIGEKISFQVKKKFIRTWLTRKRYRRKKQRHRGDKPSWSQEPLPARGWEAPTEHRHHRALIQELERL